MRHFVLVLSVLLSGCAKNSTLIKHFPQKSSAIKFYAWADKINSDGTLMFASPIDDTCLKSDDFLKRKTYAVHFSKKDAPMQMDVYLNKTIVKRYFFGDGGKIAKSIDLKNGNTCMYKILKEKHKSRIIRTCQNGSVQIYTYRKTHLIEASFVNNDQNKTMVIEGGRYKLYQNGNLVEKGDYIPIEESIPVSPKC